MRHRRPSAGIFAAGQPRGHARHRCRFLSCGHRGGAWRCEQGEIRDHHDAEPLHQPPVGEVDLLSRSTTWTLGREGNLGLEFAWVNYYDGTGFLVKASTGVKSAKEMDGATICVQPGTSTELAINDYFRLNNLKFTPILIQDLSEVQAAFLSGRCDAYSTDASALATFRFSQGPKAQDLVLLPDIISKEPLGVMVRKGDDKWFDLVRWTFVAMITAEEKGSPARTSTASPTPPTPTSAGC